METEPELDGESGRIVVERSVGAFSPVAAGVVDPALAAGAARWVASGSCGTVELCATSDGELHVADRGTRLAAGVRALCGTWQDLAPPVRVDAALHWTSEQLCARCAAKDLSVVDVVRDARAVRVTAERVRAWSVAPPSWVEVHRAVLAAEHLRDSSGPGAAWVADVLDGAARRLERELQACRDVWAQEWVAAVAADLVGRTGAVDPELERLAGGGRTLRLRSLYCAGTPGQMRWDGRYGVRVRQLPAGSCSRAEGWEDAPGEVARWTESCQRAAREQVERWDATARALVGWGTAAEAVVRVPGRDGGLVDAMGLLFPEVPGGSEVPLLAAVWLQRTAAPTQCEVVGTTLRACVALGLHGVPVEHLGLVVQGAVA